MQVEALKKQLKEKEDENTGLKENALRLHKVVDEIRAGTRESDEGDGLIDILVTISNAFQICRRMPTLEEGGGGGGREEENQTQEFEITKPFLGDPHATPLCKGEKLERAEARNLATSDA